MLWGHDILILETKSNLCTETEVTCIISMHLQISHVLIVIIPARMSHW
jgi:hypothetical protein